MMTIDITTVLSPDLKSRMRAKDLRLFVENTGESEISLDFQNVKFATRSFMDEFYNLFLKDQGENAFRVELVNIPEDIAALLESVSNTQIRAKTIPATAKVKEFGSVEDFMQYMSTVTF